MKESQQIYKDYLHYSFQIEKLEVQLSNPLFIQKAKPEMVAVTKQKYTDFQQKLNKLHDQTIAILDTIGNRNLVVAYIQYHRENLYLSQISSHLNTTSIDRSEVFNLCTFDQKYFETIYEHITYHEKFQLLIQLPFLK